MKKLFALLICLFMLTACEYEEYFPDYPVETYDIENTADGIYIVEYWQKKLNSISEILQKNITEQEIIDVFNRCEYDSTYILEIYNYKKGEKENDKT